MRGVWCFFTISFVVACSNNPLKDQIAKSQQKPQKLNFVATSSSLKGLHDRYGELLSKYEGVRVVFASDDADSIPTLANELNQSLVRLLKDSREKHVASLQNIRKVVPRLKEAQTMELLRLSFGDLSREMLQLYREVEAKGFVRYRCPMAKGFSDWIQLEAEKMANPYMGKRMLSCGYPVDMSG